MLADAVRYAPDILSRGSLGSERKWKREKRERVTKPRCRAGASSLAFGVA